MSNCAELWCINDVCLFPFLPSGIFPSLSRRFDCWRPSQKAERIYWKPNDWTFQPLFWALRQAVCLKIELGSPFLCSLFHSYLFWRSLLVTRWVVSKSVCRSIHCKLKREGLQVMYPQAKWRRSGMKKVSLSNRKLERKIYWAQDLWKCLESYSLLFDNSDFWRFLFSP